jgi:hypothetical protein
MDVTVHKQSPIIESISPVYLCDSGTYSEYSVEGTDDGSIVKTGFKFGLDKLPGGIFVCEVQRKGNIEFDHYSSADTTFTEDVENISETMRLLVAWKINYLWWPNVQIVLIVYGNELVLNEDKLTQLYSKIDDQFFERHDASESTWLVCDDTVLEITYEIVQKVGIELKITISEGVEDENAEPALWIDSEGQYHL